MFSLFSKLILAFTCVTLLPLGTSLAQPTPDAAPLEEEADTNEEPTPAAGDQAQGEAQPQKIRFAALVQFVSGTTEKIDSKKVRTPLAFSTALYEGDRVRIEKGSFVKLALKNRCVMVAYGPATLQTPVHEKLWRPRAEALRVICPQNTEQRLMYRGLEVNAGAAELFFVNDKMIVVRGKPQGKGLVVAEPLSSFAATKSGWVQAKKPTDTELYKWHTTYKAPKEALAIAKSKEQEKPYLPPKNRIMVGPAGGDAQLLRDFGAFSDNDLISDSGRIQYHRRRGKGSLIILIQPHFEISQDGEQDSFSFNENVNSTIKMSGAEIGWRLDHDRWWSPYVRGGLYYMQNETNYSDMLIDLERKYEHYGVSLAAGADFYWRPNFLRWFGLYGALEAQALRTVVRGQTITRNLFPPPPTPPVPDWLGGHYTLVMWNLSLGLMFQF